MRKNLGIYIHIPFCASRCAYCDFYSLARSERNMPKYQQALLQHIKESSKQLSGYYIDTVYFGGGTPSYYGADKIVELFNALKKHGRVLVDSEVTVEVNPDSITKSGMLKLRRAGINRLSMGVQSTNDNVLKTLGRRHTFEQAEQAMRNAREAGFDNVNIDLIYGLPSQSKESWAETLVRAAAMKPDHMSCYGLKIEENTPMYIFKDSPFLPDDDAQADMYLYMVETLSRYGYKQYEISNFARRGLESKHNMKYWCGEEYLGFGAAAHSFIGGVRFNYIADLVKYTENVLSGKTVVDQREEVSKFEQAGEYLMLGLRTVHGISEEEYRNIYPSSFDDVLELLNAYREREWAEEQNGRWHLTPQGFLLSNVLIGGVLDAQSLQQASGKWRKKEDYEQKQMSLFDKKAEEMQLFHGI